MLGLSLWNWQQTSVQKAMLSQSGFVVSHDLKGSPQLLLDHSARRVAVIAIGDTREYDYAQIRQVRYEFDFSASGEVNHRLEIDLQNAPSARETILYPGDFEAEAALKQLLELAR